MKNGVTMFRNSEFENFKWFYNMTYLQSLTVTSNIKCIQMDTHTRCHFHVSYHFYKKTINNILNNQRTIK